MRMPTVPALILGGMVMAHAALSATSFKDHPVLGTWKMSSKDGACIEIYRFHPDGTVFVTSGDEVAEVLFEISPGSSRKGFYRWTQKIAKDNGKSDCSGKSMKVGDAFTWFIQFDQSQQKMIVCKAEAIDLCFGPLQRIRDGGS